MIAKDEVNGAKHQPRREQHYEGMRPHGTTAITTQRAVHLQRFCDHPIPKICFVPLSRKTNNKAQLNTMSNTKVLNGFLSAALANLERTPPRHPYDEKHQERILGKCSLKREVLPLQFERLPLAIDSRTKGKLSPM